MITQAVESPEAVPGPSTTTVPRSMMRSFKTAGPTRASGSIEDSKG